MKQLSKNNSTYLFILLTGVLVVVAYVSFNRILHYNKPVEDLMHVNRVKNAIADVLTNLKDAEIKQRGYLLTGDSVFIQPLTNTNEDIRPDFVTLSSLISDIRQQENLQKLKSIVDERYALLNTNLSLLKNIPSNTLIKEALLQDNNKMNEIRSQILLMLETEDKLVTERTNYKDNTASITPIFLFSLSLLSIIVITFFFFRLQKETNERVTITESNKLLQEAKQQIEISEKLLSNILSQSLMAIAIFKEPGMIVTFANERMLKLLGKDTSILNKPFQEGVPELKNQILPQLLDKVYSTGVPYEGLEIKVNLVRNGMQEESYLNIVFQPYRDIYGMVTGITVFITEVTEHFLSKKQIEESEVRFRTLSETIPHMLWTATPDGRKNFFNKYFLDYTGFTFDELEGEGWQRIIFPDDLERELSQWNHSIQTGEDLTIEKRVRHHSGEYRWHITRGIAQKNNEGVIIGWLGTSTEIDNQKKITEALAKGEEQFRTFANSIQNLAWIANGDGWIYWYNQRWYDYTGTTIEEMEGWGWKKVHHPDHIQKVVAFVKEAWKNNEAFEITFPLRRYDGEYRWFLSRAYPVTDSKGNIERWIGTNTDITEQKNFTEELERKVKERTKELLIQNHTFEIAEKIAALGSYKWNITTKELVYSNNLFRLLDCEPQEFTPTLEKFRSFIHPDDLQKVINSKDQTIKIEALVDTPYRIISKLGNVKHFRSSGNFSGEGGNYILIGTVQDITSDVEASKELKAKNIELENANAELASFNYVASHDLQEPLRKIQGFSKRIINEEANHLSDKAKDYFKRINAAAQRMQNLITSLLSYSRTNNAELLFVKTDLNKTLNEVKLTLHESIKAKNAIIKSDHLPTIDAIQVQMHQLFVNLIGNSLKYSKKNEAPLINITAEKVNNSENEGRENQYGFFWKIAITDNGIGFEQQYEHKIFEIFQRLHGKSEYEGTGIGLVICKKIIMAHHGSISAIGKPGIGSTFTFLLPENNKV